jgi:hypothetical protein
VPSWLAASIDDFADQTSTDEYLFAIMTPERMYRRVSDPR